MKHVIYFKIVLIFLLYCFFTHVQNCTYVSSFALFNHLCKIRDTINRDVYGFQSLLIAIFRQNLFNVLQYLSYYQCIQIRSYCIYEPFYFVLYHFRWVLTLFPFQLLVLFCNAVIVWEFSITYVLYLLVQVAQYLCTWCVNHAVKVK